MDTNNLDIKYQKLAAEYSKLRAQASVLKKAVIEEQTKTSTLRDSLRQKETSLRRSEQEVDSLGFRNKQLEHRVASLQDDFKKESQKALHKNQKNNKTNHKSNGTTSGNFDSNTTTSSAYKSVSSDPLIFEELQKKIMENAELTSCIDDKERENNMYCERIKELEKQLEKRNTESIELEKRLRKDLDSLHAKNSELETKLVEAASIIGSEDALSASGSDSTTPLNSSTTEDRIITLEKEVFHWRTQYEILKITESSLLDNQKNCKFNGFQQQSNTLPAAACTVRPGSSNDKKIPKESNLERNKEQLLFQHFSQKFEELLRSKCVAESRLSSYITECENLQVSLESLLNDLKCKEFEIKESEKNVRRLDEDLTTTRLNYEEQISVLTEQVLNLSDQLAAIT